MHSYSNICYHYASTRPYFLLLKYTSYLSLHFLSHTHSRHHPYGGATPPPAPHRRRPELPPRQGSLHLSSPRRRDPLPPRRRPPLSSRSHSYRDHHRPSRRHPGLRHLQPHLGPAALTIALAVTGFLTSGAFGITALSSISWLLNYVRRMRGSLPEQLDHARRRVQETVGQKTTEAGQKTQDVMRP
ncbi:UNVERIFIED_CONTAM: Oleosin [Sesamum calycinum]|uniref:Oleosin n=1 Tax=Sesamum calycinum TaxID=2727403 RepID=A0AAW2ND89_9LAMI